MVKIKKIGFILFIMLVFITGCLSSTLVIIVSKDFQTPISFDFSPLSRTGIAKEQLSPNDHIKESQISVYNDKVVIELDNPFWSRFTNTNSMDPLIDEHSNGIEIKPKSPDQLIEGDIISYRSEYADGIIIHRIIKIGTDEYGWYAIAKGDNNTNEDPGKIRFHQIHGVLVGILY